MTAGIITNYLLLVFTKQKHVMNYGDVKLKGCHTRLPNRGGKGKSGDGGVLAAGEEQAGALKKLLRTQETSM